MSPFDHFLDPQSMQRLFKTINRWFIQILLSLTLFQQFTTGGGGGGSGWLRAYQNDYVIDNYVKPAVIRQTHTAHVDKYHLH